MPNFEIAHINKQGQNIIILPLGRQFDSVPQTKKLEFLGCVQAAAHSAGLAGTVVPVWEAGRGRSAFIAPPQWHGYFSTLSLYQIMQMRNKTLWCA
jgi:hypothetical protein